MAGADGVAVLGVDEVEQADVGVVRRRREAEQVAGGRRGEQQPEVAVHDRDAVGAGLDQPAEVLLAADEVLGDPAVLADAEHQAQRP